MKKMVVGILCLVHGGVIVVCSKQDYHQLVVALLGTGVFFVNMYIKAYNIIIVVWLCLSDTAEQQQTYEISLLTTSPAQ